MVIFYNEGQVTKSEKSTVVCLAKAMVFPVVMYGCESWTIKNHSEGDQPWDFFGGNDAEAETPVLWPPHAKSCLFGKD